MKTLQQHLRITKGESVFAVSSLGPYDKPAKDFYFNLCSMSGVLEDRNHVLFAAAYKSWDNTQPMPEFSCNAYDIESDSISHILFVPRKKVLGYYVSDYAIEQYGKEPVLAAALNEIAMLGYEEMGVNLDLEQQNMDPMPEYSTERKGLKCVLKEIGVDPVCLEMTPEERDYAIQAMNYNAGINKLHADKIRELLKKE